MRAVILLNEAAGRGSARAKHVLIRKLAAEAGVEVRDNSDSLSLRARFAVRQGCDRIIAAGGDGTVHAVLNGMFGSGATLAIIPAGSGNDLAANLGIPCDVRTALDLALTGPVREMDVCEIGKRRYFACIASFGIDSFANKIANQHRGPFRGTALYIWSLLVSLARFRPPTVTVTHDNGEFTSEIMLLAAANAASYGGGLRIAPDAKLDDGIIDLIAVRKMSRLRLLWHFRKIFNGSHIHLGEVTHIRSRRLRVRADRRLDIFADGEFEGQTSQTITILPRALKVIAPL